MANCEPEIFTEWDVPNIEVTVCPDLEDAIDHLIGKWWSSVVGWNC